MDTRYSTNSALRAGIGAQALTYVAAILPTVKVRAVGDPDRRVSAKQLVLSLPNHTWRTITWGDGSADPLRSRFARVRVRTTPIGGAATCPEDTLLIEWQHSRDSRSNRVSLRSSTEPRPHRASSSHIQGMPLHARPQST
jgi:hypothetical protein